MDDGGRGVVQGTGRSDRPGLACCFTGRSSLCGSRTTVTAPCQPRPMCAAIKHQPVTQGGVRSKWLSGSIVIAALGKKRRRTSHACKRRNPTRMIKRRHQDFRNEFVISYPSVPAPKINPYAVPKPAVCTCRPENNF